MNNKRNKIIYLISTGVLTLLTLVTGGLYFFDTPTISKVFTSLGFPTYLIYPVAIARILGIIAIWSNKSKTLKEWAYAGFFFLLTLALSAPNIVENGDAPGALIALVALIISYFSGKKLSSSDNKNN